MGSPSPEGRGCREAAGEGYRTKILFIWKPSLRFDNSRRSDVVQLWILAVEVGVSFLLDAVLIRSGTVGRTFTVVCVKLIDNFHSTGHDCKRRETGCIESGIIAVIDEQLSGSRIRTGCCEADHPPGVVLCHRVVLDIGIRPLRSHTGIAVDSELCHEWTRRTN